MALLFIILCFLPSCAGFSVWAPVSRVVAIRAQSIVLGCEFTIEADSEFSQLIVTWQRVEDSRVVHSFYYQKDQLETQHVDYRSRTALFISELKKGNASVRIDQVGPRDAGAYLCTVNNNKGTNKAQVHLDIGAFYTEPRLSIYMNCSSITVIYMTEGYPKPEVVWWGEQNQMLNNQTEFNEETDGAGRPLGLYYVKSSHVSEHSALNVTFTLKNQLLNQTLSRTVSIGQGDGKLQCGVNTAVIVLSVLFSLLLLSVCIVCVLIMMRRKKQLYSQAPTNGNQLKSETRIQTNGMATE